MAFHHTLSSADLPLHHYPQQPHPDTTPNWLNSALLRPPSQQPHFSDSNFLNLHTAAAAANNNNNNNNSAATNSDSTTNPTTTQWLSRSSSLLNRNNHSDVINDVTATDSIIAMSHDSAELKANSEGMTNNNNTKSEGVAVESGGGDGGGVMNWQNARYKAEILGHPLYDQLLSAHVACLRIATPVDQLPRIDAQLAQSQHVVAKYSALSAATHALVGDDKELDQFMSCVCGCGMWEDREKEEEDWHRQGNKGG